VDRQDRREGRDYRRAVRRRGAQLADLLQFIGGTRSAGRAGARHGSVGRPAVDWALRVDALTAVMLVVVTTRLSLVHLYSWGYMEEDPSQLAFFAYLSLFSFAMLMLVTADSLVQMFFGWEGVGLASYLLIGFWYHKPSANAAARKAFIVNRIGDLRPSA
jgi:NADH:ubiquinone oxidoreductase subunit 5 (subunit L)/multisubunit Na+/H+ antiporter MnhA subunit